MRTKYPIAVDMDGVVANFILGAARIMDIDYTEKDHTSWNFKDTIGIPDGEIWKKIKSSHEFWENLEVLPRGRELIQAIEARGWEWYFLTDPGIDIKAYTGKARWAMQHFGKLPVVCPHSRGGPGKAIIGRGWLIDDKPSNISDWEFAGGYAIGWAKPWNKFRKMTAEQIVSQIERMGGAYAVSA